MIHLTRKPAPAGLDPAPNNVPADAAFDPVWHGPFMRNLSEPESADIIPLPVDPRARALRHERAAIDSERDARAHAKRLRLIRAYLAMRRRHAMMETSYDKMGKAWQEIQYCEQEAQGALHRANLEIARLKADLASQPTNDGAAHKANAERLERLLFEAGQREGDLKRANAQFIAERDDARRVLADTIRRTDSERAEMQGAIARGVAGIEALAERLADIERAERQPMHRAA